MHPWNWTSAAVRAGALVLVQVVTVALAHDPAPTIVDLIAFVPVGLLLDALPGFVYVGLVRTWTGTVIGGVAVVVVQLGVVAHLTALSSTSSTAGVGLLALPVLLLVPVLGVVVWERRATTTTTSVTGAPADPRGQPST